MAILKGLARAESRRFEAKRALNYELANLITFAFHDPQEMPEYEIGGGTDRSAVRVEIDAIEVRAALQAICASGR